MLRDTAESNLIGNDRFEGYVVDLIDTISKQLKFNYTLQINPSGMIGSVDKSGRWNGMIGEIVDGRAHIAAGSISITRNRESAVDFTVPFMNLGIGVIVKTEIYEKSALDDFVDIFYPFSRHYSTVTFFLLTLIFGIILLVLRRKYKTAIFRILLGIWFLFLFMFTSLYISQLASNYNSNYYKVEAFRTFEELASQDHVVYGCIKGGSTEAFLRDSKHPLYRKMWSRMVEMEPTPFVLTNMEGIERVRQGNYAFISESSIIEYATSRHCDLHQIGDLITSKGYGLAVQQGSPLRESLSYAILQLQEDGTLSLLKNKWWNELNGGGTC
ncbi:probable glutamate receptor isoform X2 [Bradysia coprophila]|nr:probable glutamate receptor isoform X2 [Bradysia coprophila]